MYVADGETEFEDNWRLNEIVKTIGTGVSLGNFFIFFFDFHGSEVTFYWKYIFYLYL